MTSELTKYNPNEVAEFGKSFMVGLIAQAAMEQEAQALATRANEAKQFLGFEMLKAVMDLSDRFDNIDVAAIYGKAKDVEKLNQRILIRMGVLDQSIVDDEIVIKWTDDGIEALYSYTAELKEKDEAEYNRRFNNRKRLNGRLSEACKIAYELRANGLSADDLVYKENDKGENVPVIVNAPKAISGGKKEVALGARSPVEGATLSPTMSSLVKLSKKRFDDAHPSEAKASKGTDAGEKRDSDVSMGMSDEQFGTIVNTVIRGVNAQEGEFTEQMIKQLKSLADTIAPVIKAGPTKKADS